MNFGDIILIILATHGAIDLTCSLWLLCRGYRVQWWKDGRKL